jgi:hypothetical protein
MLLMVMVIVSCSDRLQGINSNLKNVPAEKLKIDGAEAQVLLPQAELNITSTAAGGLQLMQNLGADSYAGYQTTPTPFVGNANNVTYKFIDSWVNAIWNTPRNTLNNWLKFKTKGYDTEYPDLYGIALICKVFAASQASKAFGPIPYSKYGQSSTVPFDDPKTLYDAFFKDLDQAIHNLKKVENAHPSADQTRFKPVDHSTFGGDYAEWIKLAKTLKLRLAVHISLIEPAKAKQEAEEAVKGKKYGVLDMNDGSFSMKPTGAFGYYTMTESWGDARMGASMISILKGYNDPRLPKYALKATDPAAVAGKYKGIRPGVAKPAKSRYGGYSKGNWSKSQALKLLDVGESYFLRAEGVLRGWDMGNSNFGTAGWTAGQFYKAGVRASFKENGVSGANAYLSNDTGHQIPYVDPQNHGNDSPPLNFVTVKWDPGASKVVKLKRIIMQKWISMFPDGDEAWEEFRRTGYPHMYPVKINDSGGKIPKGTFIKRFPYSSTFTNTSQQQVDDAVNKYLDGNDTGGQPLWWDLKQGPLGLVNH